MALQTSGCSARQTRRHAHHSRQVRTSQAVRLKSRKSLRLGWRQADSQAPVLRTQPRNSRHKVSEQQAGCRDADAPGIN